METSLHDLPERALGWVAKAIDPEAVILSARKLHGGVSSPVHSISVEVRGEVSEVVLRRFDSAEWVCREPDLARREAASLLKAAYIVGVDTPGLIAFDDTGSECGTPAVLMSRVAGEVVLEPSDSTAWLKGLAQALGRIHAVEPNDFPWTFAPYVDASTLDTSSWSSIPDKWKIASDIVTSAKPSAVKRFIHRDYHPANVLWSEGEISGIVDWVNGCIGPAGIDVGHCRVNLALLHGVEIADEFLAFYRGEQGDSFVYDPYWDFVTLIDFAYWRPEVYGGWTALGMTGLTNEMMFERLDRYLVSLLDRTR